MIKYLQCRYLRRNGEQCTAEAADTSVDAHILLCVKHLALAMRVVAEHSQTSAA